MAVHRLPLSRDSQARASSDTFWSTQRWPDATRAGRPNRTVLALHVDDRVLGELAAFDVESEDLEGDEDLEDDAPPVTGCGNRTN